MQHEFTQNVKIQKIKFTLDRKHASALNGKQESELCLERLGAIKNIVNQEHRGFPNYFVFAPNVCDENLAAHCHGSRIFDAAFQLNLELGNSHIPVGKNQLLFRSQTSHWKLGAIPTTHSFDL